MDKRIKYNRLRHPELVFTKGSIRAGSRNALTCMFNEMLSKWIPHRSPWVPWGKQVTNEHSLQKDTNSNSPSAEGRRGSFDPPEAERSGVVVNFNSKRRFPTKINPLTSAQISRTLPLDKGENLSPAVHSIFISRKSGWSSQGDVFFKTIIAFFFLLLTLTTTAQPLPEYLQTAGENNPTLQSKYKAYEAALQKLPQVSTLPDPQFSFGYFLSPVETRVGPQRAKFSLSQMFPWFGTLDARESVAAQYAEVKFQQFLDARNELFLKVKKQYYDIYELKEQIEIMEENIELLNSYENLARIRYQNNQAKMVDVIRVQMRKEEMQTMLVILEEKLQPLVVGFNAFLHRSPEAEVVVTDTLNPFISDTLTYERDDILQNPQLTAIAHKQQAATFEERAAIKSGLPQLGVGLDYVLVDERTDMTLPDNGKNVIMPMVSATIPIFRKKYQGQKREAVLKQEQYELEKTGKEENLVAEFEMKTYQLVEAGDKVTLYRRLTGRANQALNILTTSYSTGEEEFEELLRMEEELLEYRLKFLEAVTNQYRQKAELDYLTGKDL